MARTRSVDTRIRDAQAVDLRRRGLTYQQIADQLKLSSAGKAHDAVRRGVRDAFREDFNEQVYLEESLLDELIRTAFRVLMTTHYVVTPAGVIATRDGKPLVDDGPVLAAIRELRYLSESRRKLRGTDAPSRARITVMTEEDLDAELADLIAGNQQLAQEVADMARKAAVDASATGTD